MNWTNQITYQPKVAYGPDNAIITINNFPNDECDRNGVYISGACTVSSSNPEPIVSIYVSNTPVTSQLKHNTTDYQFTQMITESGISYVLCRAVNSVFRDISTETITSITVKGPPKTPEIYSMSGNAITPREGNQLQVKEGNTDIVCESKGGYPLYKNITLECLTNRKSNENIDIVHMSLNITRDMQGINCTCVVWHESKCLNNIVSVSLKLFEEEKNNVGAIIGGVIAAVVGILLLVVLTVYFVRRRSNILQRQYEEAHINKMQTYSHVQGSENYVNTENHHYETPHITTEHSAQANIHTQNIRMQPKLIATPYDNLNEGFNEEPRRSSEGYKTIEVNLNLDKETDFNPEEHHYDEISDVNA